MIAPRARSADPAPDSGEQPMFRPGTPEALIEAAGRRLLAVVEDLLAEARASLDELTELREMPLRPLASVISLAREAAAMGVSWTALSSARTCETPRCGGPWRGALDFLGRRQCDPCANRRWPACTQAIPAELAPIVPVFPPARDPAA